MGRSSECALPLESLAVSRRHAQVTGQGQKFYVEDLHSSNGTFVNGKRIQDAVRLREGDKLVVGPYHFTFRLSPDPVGQESDVAASEVIPAGPELPTLRGNDPAGKLKIVLDIGRHLASTLDLEALLGKMLDDLLGLFSQADRALVFLVQDGMPVLRAHRGRQPGTSQAHPYSRTVLRRVLSEKVGILSEDVRSDPQMPKASTLESLDLLSLMCVPLIGQEGRPVGIIQLDCFQGGMIFQKEDLHLLTAVALQVAVAVENAIVHAEMLKQERVQHELALARQIQQGFLPTEFPSPGEHGFELFAHVKAAREVSGDLYDFFFLDDGRLAFLVGDVAGKGIPAALIMLAVRTHARHLAAGKDPAQVVESLNQVLIKSGHVDVFVTLVYGIYDPRTGEAVLASGGHPAPLRRLNDGRVVRLVLEAGRLLGCDASEVGTKNARVLLRPGETLVLYTDGFTEAHAPQDLKLFGVENMQREFGDCDPSLPLEECANRLEAAVQRFTGTGELQDDRTILLLRRTSASAPPASAGSSSP
jgi:serine phosphatase RsbU (regulator of sigma subunit)